MNISQAYTLGQIAKLAESFLVTHDDRCGAAGGLGCSCGAEANNEIVYEILGLLDLVIMETSEDEMSTSGLFRADIG